MSYLVIFTCWLLFLFFLLSPFIGFLLFKLRSFFLFLSFSFFFFEWFPHYKKERFFSKAKYVDCTVRVAAYSVPVQYAFSTERTPHIVTYVQQGKQRKRKEATARNDEKTHMKAEHALMNKTGYWRNGNYSVDIIKEQCYSYDYFFFRFVFHLFTRSFSRFAMFLMIFFSLQIKCVLNASVIELQRYCFFFFMYLLVTSNGRWSVMLWFYACVFYGFFVFLFLLLFYVMCVLFNVFILFRFTFYTTSSISMLIRFRFVVLCVCFFSFLNVFSWFPGESNKNVLAQYHLILNIMFFLPFNSDSE